MEPSIMNFTLKNIPDPLYRRLKTLAARNRRSLNGEIIHRLERSVGDPAADVERLLADARALREATDLPPLTDTSIREAVEDARA